MNTYIFTYRNSNALTFTVQAPTLEDAHAELDRAILAAEELGFRLPCPSSYELSAAY